MTSGAPSGPRTWSSGRSGGSGALPSSRKGVEDQVGARKLLRARRLVAPRDVAVGVGEHQRPLGEARRVVDAEGTARSPLRLPVRELRDGDAELLLERPLGPDRVARDAEQPGPALGELVEHLLVEVELVGTDGREGERVEDQHGRVAEKLRPSEPAPLL